MAKPALRLLPGTGDGCPTGLLSATLLVAAREREFDDAAWQLLDAATPAEVTLARLLFDAAGDRLKAALARKARAEAQAAGRRWLRLVEVSDG